MDKKYKFTGEEKQVNGRTLKRIVATKHFGEIEIGELGGWIEKETNLSHEGNCWVYHNAEVYGNAIVKDNAKVKRNAKVYGYAWVSGDACIEDKVEVYDNSWVHEDAWVWGNAKIYGDSRVYEKVHIYGNTRVYGNARINGSIIVCGNALVEKTRDVISFSRVGSRNDTLTAFRTKEGFSITVGCFLGDLEEFLEKVKKTHGDNEYAEEYRTIAEVLKIRFKK